MTILIPNLSELVQRGNIRSDVSGEEIIGTKRRNNVRADSKARGITSGIECWITIHGFTPHYLTSLIVSRRNKIPWTVKSLYFWVICHCTPSQSPEGGGTSLVLIWYLSVNTVIAVALLRLAKNSQKKRDGSYFSTAEKKNLPIPLGYLYVCMWTRYKIHNFMENRNTFFLSQLQSKIN